MPGTNRQALLLAAATLVVLPIIVTLLPGIQILHDPAHYLPFHTFLELFAIAVAILITGIGWNATHGDHSGHMTVLGAGFLAVGLLDVAHTLSYIGMPDFVTPSGVEKAIWFWLAARMASAVTLLAVALAPAVWPSSNRMRLLSAGASLAFTALVYFAVLFHQDFLPRTFVQGQGLTSFKITAEYVICAFYAIGALLVWLRPVRGSAFRGPVLLAALLIMVASEAAFTLYAAVNDAFNLLGHLYKVAATYLIYRAVFVDAITAPYVSLHRSEEKYREILEQAADGVIRVDAAGRIIDANHRAETMTGISRSALLGRRIDSLVENWIPAWLATSAQNSDTALWESELILPVDTNIPIEINARRLKTGEIQAIIRDITERKRHEAQLRSAETALRESEKLLRQGARLGHFGTLVWDVENDHCLYCSEEHAALFDMTVDEFMREKGSNRQMSTGAPSTDKTAFDEMLIPEVGHVYDVEFQQTMKSGELKYFREIGQTFLDETTGRLCSFGVTQDITESKNTEERLRRLAEEASELAQLAEQSNRAKSEFLANMSHELRTPLNAIMGFSDLMQKEVFGPVGDPHYRDYAHDIHASGKHLLSIITDLLDIARIESGHATLQESDIDLAGVIKECIRLVEPNSSHVTLSATALRGALTIRADERAIRQILLNLLSNAVKFTPSGGTVEVSSQLTPDGDVAIVVSDSGIGIPASDLSRVTGAFVQVETTHARKHQGVGLGLAISKALAELHGGRLQIESWPDRGTRATVILPGWRIAPPSLAALG